MSYSMKETLWMHSSDGEYFYHLDPQPDSKEEAIAAAREYYGDDLKHTQVGLARGSEMPEKFPFDSEQIDEALESYFYEESLFERHPSEAGELMDQIEAVWAAWREKHKIVGNALHFVEGPYDVTTEENAASE